MNNNNNNVHLAGIIIIWGSCFACLKPDTGLKPELARASNQCRASNRQTRASNNHNALQMNVIVILESVSFHKKYQMSCVKETQCKEVKSCYNPLRTVMVLVSSGIDFENTPRLYSDRATRCERLQIWPYGLCQREPKMPGFYKKQHRNSTNYARDEVSLFWCKGVNHIGSAMHIH